jgi:transposase
MNKITISETTVRTMGEYGPDSYQALNLTGKGRVVATVEGAIQIVKSEFGADMIKMADGYTWAIRDVLAMAQRGEHGLMLV